MPDEVRFAVDSQKFNGEQREGWNGDLISQKCQECDKALAFAICLQNVWIHMAANGKQNRLCRSLRLMLLSNKVCDVHKSKTTKNFW